MLVFFGVAGDEVIIPFDETMARLMRAFPADHPLVKDIAKCFETAGAHLQALSDVVHLPNGDAVDDDVVVSLIWALEDWKRGVRDWEEVEEKIKDVKRVPV